MVSELDCVLTRNEREYLLSLGNDRDLRQSGSSGLRKRVSVIERDEDPCSVTLAYAGIVGVDPLWWNGQRR